MTRAAANDNAAPDPFGTLRAQWIVTPERRFSVAPGVIEYLELIGKINPVASHYNWGETIDAINEFNASSDAGQPLWRLVARHDGEEYWCAAQRQDRPNHWVYFIGAADAVKIGTSVSPQTRVRELQTGNWHTLSLLGAMPGGALTEAELHLLFTDLRIRGEWYRHEQPIRDFIAEHCNRREAA